VEPTVASVARLCSSRSVSLSCATRMARREPSRSISAATPPWALRRANSRKPNSKILSMPVAPPRDSTARYSELRSPPDQNVFSKRSASRRARRTTIPLRKMMAQEVKEAASRMPMTICTTTLACTTRRMIDNSPPISSSLPGGRHRDSRQLLGYDSRQAPRFHRARIYTGHPHGGAQQQRFPGLRTGLIAPDTLLECQARAALAARHTLHPQHILEPRGPVVARLQFDHRKHHAGVERQRTLRDAARAQPFAARALEEAQVVCIVNDAARIGILPVDPGLPAEGAQASSPNSGRLAAARSGIGRPKCCQARRAAIRPLAVRVMNPC